MDNVLIVVSHWLKMALHHLSCVYRNMCCYNFMHRNTNNGKYGFMADILQSHIYKYLFTALSATLHSCHQEIFTLLRFLYQSVQKYTEFFVIIVGNDS